MRSPTRRIRAQCVSSLDFASRRADAVALTVNLHIGAARGPRLDLQTSHKERVTHS